MMSITKLSMLFDEENREKISQEVKTIFTEIRSVADNSKRMSMVLAPDDERRDGLCAQLIREANDKGLLAVIHKEESGGGEIRLFVTSPGETWRVPAYLSMKRAFRDCSWSDGAEFLEGILLGYSEDQMVSWIEAHRRKRVGWSGPTCYFIMDRSQRNAIKRLADRCIDPSSIREEIEAFYSVNSLPLKEDFRDFLPEGKSLCRASVNFAFFKILFDRDINAKKKNEFFVSTINARNAGGLNESLQSNLIFLND